MPWLLLFICLLLSIGGAEGKKKADSDKKLDLEMELLLQQLSTKPELMNINYLRYFIGVPEIPTQYNLTRNFFWYDQHRHPLYEMHQEEEPRGQILKSTFIAHIHVPKLTLDEVDKEFGNKGKHLFDNRFAIAERFSFAANTYLTFTMARNEFHLDRAAIEYEGPALPPPSAEDMFAAREGLLNRALLLENQGDFVQATPLLQFALSEHPDNGYAHLALARALLKQGAVPQSANEYRTALALSSGDEKLQKQCVQGLQDLHLMPLPASELQKQQNIQRIHRGQRLKVAKPHKKKDDSDSTDQDQSDSSPQPTP